MDDPFQARRLGGFKGGVEYPAGAGDAGRLEEPAAQGQGQLGFAGAGGAVQQDDRVGAQGAFQLAHFRLPANQPVAAGGGYLQVLLRGGILRVYHRGGQRVGAVFGDGGGQIVAGTIDGGGLPVPGNAAAVDGESFRGVHQLPAQGGHGGGDSIAPGQAGVESPHSRFRNVRVQRRGQEGNLGDAGAGQGQGGAGPEGGGGGVGLEAGGQQGYLDAGRRQQRAQFGRGHGVRGAGFVFQPDGAGGVQGNAVQMGDVVVGGAAFQQPAHCFQSGRARVVQGRLGVQAFQGRHGGGRQAAAGDDGAGKQRATGGDGFIKGRWRKHQDIEDVLAAFVGLVGGDRRSGLPGHAGQSGNEVAQPGVVEQFPGQGEEVGVWGDDSQFGGVGAGGRGQGVVQKAAGGAGGGESQLKEETAQVAHCGFHRGEARQGVHAGAQIFGVVAVKGGAFVGGEGQGERGRGSGADIGSRLDEAHLQLPGVG